MPEGPCSHCLTLSVAIFIHSSKFASKGMMRFMGATADPTTSRSSSPFAGVCGLFCPPREASRRPGVAEALIESLWASWNACRRFAFSCLSSFKGTLQGVSAPNCRSSVVDFYFSGDFCGVADILFLVLGRGIAGVDGRRGVGLRLFVYVVRSRSAGPP